MASQQVTLVGVAYTDKTGNPPIHLTIVAEMYSTGLVVGGGPMPGGKPPYVDAGFPAPQPGIDNSLPQPQPHPDHSLPGPQPVPGWPPIAMPPIFYPPEGTPPSGSGGEDGFVKPPPEGGGWAYHSEYGWLFSPSGAGPKTSP